MEKLEKKHDVLFNRFLSTIRSHFREREELLRRLGTLGARWAIATTGRKKQTKKLLRKLRIPATAVVITGDDVAKAKPSPDVFVAAADRLRIPVENCIVVGDSIWDMLAAGRRRALSVGSSLRWLQPVRTGASWRLPRLYRSSRDAGTHRRCRSWLNTI